MLHVCVYMYKGEWEVGWDREYPLKLSAWGFVMIDGPVCPEIIFVQLVRQQAWRPCRVPITTACVNSVKHRSADDGNGDGDDSDSNDDDNDDGSRCQGGWPRGYREHRPKNDDGTRKCRVALLIDREMREVRIARGLFVISLLSSCRNSRHVARINRKCRRHWRAFDSLKFARTSVLSSR